jgi:very-short-patch-repair endonuclease
MFHPMSIARARNLRQTANRPEKVAWEALRRLRAEGVVVRRQHPIDRYVVDFAVVQARLVIEIDGSIHARHDVAERDDARDAQLKALGWRTLRVPAHTALSKDTLLSAVRIALKGGGVTYV